MILIYPPVAKISEPPPGVAILSGALRENNIDCKVIDANLEGMLWLARSSEASSVRVDKWSRRAVTHLERNLSDLKDISIYKNMAKYRQRVMELNRAVAIAPSEKFKISLSDYTDSSLTPVNSKDLLLSAREYNQNPFYPFFETYLARKIEGYRHSSCYIGISLCYLSQALTAFALSGWIRARFPDRKIVMGGGLVTSWMSMPTWSDPFKDLIDLMVRGRGEEALVSLSSGGGDLSNMDNKSQSKIAPSEMDLSRMDLPASCVPLNRAISVNRDVKDQKTGVDLKRKSYRPDFSFCNWDQYIAPGRTLPFRTTSGCYWNRCRFCPEKAEGNRYQPDKKGDLLVDLQHLVNKYRPNYVHFIDDAIPPYFLKALASRHMSKPSISEISHREVVTSDLISENSKTDQFYPFTWYGFVRFTKELANPEFCHALYRSGCRLLKLGLESGDQAVLDKMEKGTDLKLASQVLTSLKSAGIQTYVYLLFGTQFEDEPEAERTLDYVLHHSDRISFLNLAIFNLPRFSEDAGSLETTLFSAGDLSLYLSFKHPMGWDRKRVRMFLEKKFKKHPAIGEILQHDPPFFTSNHAMFIAS